LRRIKFYLRKRQVLLGREDFLEKNKYSLRKKEVFLGREDFPSGKIDSP